MFTKSKKVLHVCLINMKEKLVKNYLSSTNECMRYMIQYALNNPHPMDKQTQLKTLLSRKLLTRVVINENECTV